MNLSEAVTFQVQVDFETVSGTPLTFAVKLSGPSRDEVKVGYAANSRTATLAEDFRVAKGELVLKLARPTPY